VSNSQRLLDVVTKTAASVDPVLIADMTDAGQDYSRIDFAADDTLITSLISSATQWAEKFTGRAFITQTKIAFFEDYSSMVRLPYAPIDTSTAIIVNRKFLDQTTLLTLNNDYYLIGITSQPSDIKLSLTGVGDVSAGKYPPETFGNGYNLEIEYVCGYGAAGSDVPDPILEAIMKITATSYETRNDHSKEETFEVPQDAKNLLWPYRTPEVLI